MRFDLTKYDISQATHKLRCRHVVGRGLGYNYTMPCIVIKTTKRRKLKIIVFGSRYWKHKEYIKQIRYVLPFRVFEANQ